jgi:hypothetical protein
LDSFRGLPSEASQKARRTRTPRRIETKLWINAEQPIHAGAKSIVLALNDSGKLGHNAVAQRSPAKLFPWILAVRGRGEKYELGR